MIPEEIFELAEKHVFNKQKEIFEILLACSELGVRTSAGQILITIISVLIEHHKIFEEEFIIKENSKEIKEVVTRFLINLLNLMPQEVAKNWTKFQQYFDVIRYIFIY